MEFQDQHNEYIQLVDRELERLLPDEDILQKSVVDAMRYSVTAGGKRIRPVLTLEVCRMLGGDPHKALPFACAVELIHSYSLIHDDLPCMDDDAMRRGKPSCHIAFGESTALLAGDALLTLAFETASHAPQTHGTGCEETLRAISILSRLAGVHGMIGGQVIDLESEGRGIEYPVLHQMHLLKTGALIKAACQMGAAAAGAQEEDLDKIGEYADALGLAFQICDDILDVVGDEAQLGKPVGSDKQQQKTSFITLFGLEESRSNAQMMTTLAKESLASFEHNGFLLALTDLLLNRNK